MEGLLWRSAKAQLYGQEALYVKETLGREHIQRNKVALRELICLQEILSDLQQGRCGPEGLRRAHANAEGSWKSLQKAAAARGVPPERLCPHADPRVVRFLRARCAGSSAGHASCGSEAASTRVPSTVPDHDARSSVTDLRSEFAAEPHHPRPGRGQRMGRDQLDRLAAALRCSLEEEHTALLAAVDEIQALMEAEVQGLASEPSQSDLEAFVAAAEEALRQAELDAEAASEAAAERHVPFTYAYFFSEELIHNASQHEQEAPPSPCDASERGRNSVESQSSAARAPPALRWADLSDSDGAIGDGDDDSALGQPGTPSAPSTSSPVAKDDKEESQRSRWADLDDLNDDRRVEEPRAPNPSSPSARRVSWATAVSTPEVQDVGLQDSAAAAQCCNCGAADRRSFSRRAWRQLRSGQNTDRSCVVLCLACAAAKE